MNDVRELIEELRGPLYRIGRRTADGAAAALTAALEREEALREALAAKCAVTDAMEKAGVNHALHDSVSSASGGWPGYVRRLWGAMNMARISDSSPENTNGN